MSVTPQVPLDETAGVFRAAPIVRLPRFGAYARAVLLLLCIVLTVAVSANFARTGAFGFDFRGTLWDSGKAILGGHSPYPPPRADAISTGNPAVYPPVAMLLVAPLTVLPWGVGLGIWLALCLAASVAAFLLLGARDLRVFVVVLASAPFVTAFVHGNLTMLLLLGLAAAWRWRDRPAIAGFSVGAVVAAKIFLWPLLVWLVATRRFRAAAYAGVGAVVAVVGSWAVIGFAGFRDYPKLLNALDDVYTRHTQSLASLGLRLGLSPEAAKLVALLVGCLVLAVGIRLVRREHGDRLMYSAAVLAAIAASPIGWLYYYTLLAVPLVLYRPTLTRAWWIVGGFWPLTFVAGFLIPTPPCCRPPGLAKEAWITLNTTPPLLLTGGTALLLAAAALFMLRSSPRRLPA
jgi:hypothetical protein